MNILITGGNSGIGAQAAREMAEGNTIFVSYRSHHEKAQAIAQDVERLSGKCILIPADLSDERGCLELFQKIAEETDMLDVLVNCAGGLVSRVKTPQITWKDMEAVFSLNVFSAVRITSLAIPFLQKAKTPCIVNITSGAILSGSTGAPLYADMLPL